DKFTAMELAINQGRAIFDHIRQFVVYLLSCNLAEVLTVGLAALLSLPAPLLPLQILFLNLVTDIFPALALGMGKGEVDIMERPPRNAGEPIMTKKLWSSTIYLWPKHYCCCYRYYSVFPLSITTFIQNHKQYGILYFGIGAIVQCI